MQGVHEGIQALTGSMLLLPVTPCPGPAHTSLYIERVCGSVPLVSSQKHLC